MSAPPASSTEVERLGAVPAEVDRSQVARVLLVEDDVGEAHLIRAALDSGGRGRFVLEHVTRLADAQARLGDGGIDVVLLDLGLPDSRGIATFTALQNQHRDVPVIVLTGLDDDDVALQAVHAGAQDYVVKGSLVDHQLVRLVRHAIERHHLHREVERLARQQGALAGISRHALEDAPLDELFADACRTLTQTLEVPMALVVERLVDGRGLVRAAVGFGDDPTGSVLPVPPPGHPGGMVGPLSPVVVEDTEAAGFPLPAPYRQELRSGVAVGLDGGGFEGILAVHDRRVRRYDSDTVSFLMAAANVLSESIRRGLAEHQLGERVKELTALATISRLAQRSVDTRELLAHVADALLATMQWPDDASVHVRIDDQVAGRADVGGLVSRLSARIAVAGDERGTIVVGYDDQRSFLLPFEQQVLDAVAETLTTWLERREAVIALAEREERLRSVLSNMPGIVWVVDRDLRVVSHLGRTHETIGLEPDSLVGSHGADVLGHDSIGVRAARAAIDGGEESHYDEQALGRWWETHVRPLRDVRGEVVGAIGLGLDVTDAKAAEQELEASRRRLQGLFDNALDAILLANDDGRYVDVNPAACDLTGYGRDELLRMSLHEITPAEVGVDAAAAWAAFLTAGAASGEFVVRRCDGTLVETEFRAVANVVPGVHLSVMRDVSDRSRAERELRRSEERFRSLVQHAADLIVLLDADARLLWASPAAETLLGWLPEEMVGLDGFSFVHPEDEPRMREFWQRAVGGRQPASPPAYRARRRDGSWRWVEQTVTNLIDDPSVNAVVLNARDVTERHEAELALRESEERFRRLTENAQDTIYRIRLVPELAVEYVSGAVRDLLGYTPEELYADADIVLELVHPDDRGPAEVRASDLAALPSPMVVRLRRRDGAYVWLEQRHTYVRDTVGRVVALEGIARDVSERMQAEERLRDALEREQEATDRLRRLDDMKSTFLSAVSHELRTPLTSVLGFSQLLLQRHALLSTEQVMQLLERLAHNAERLERLLDNLLDVDRLSRDALTPDLDRWDVALLLARTLEDMDLKGHVVTIEAKPLQAVVDGPKLERIVENLVGNAVRHTPRGTVVRVGAARHDGGLLITVEDLGPGIPDELKTQIFEPFQFGDSDAAKVGGAGLGLAIVGRFAELHDGRAWVEDRPGGGSSFRVWIPQPGS